MIFFHYTQSISIQITNELIFVRSYLNAEILFHELMKGNQLRTKL